MITQNMTLGELISALQYKESLHGSDLLVYVEQEGRVHTRPLRIVRRPAGIVSRTEFPDRIVIEADSEEYL